MLVYLVGSPYLSTDCLELTHYQLVPYKPTRHFLSYV
jgi:hypothetical protein